MQVPAGGLPVTGTILQHIPGYIEATPEAATFDTLDQLLAVPFVAMWPDRPSAWGDHFYRFSLSHDDTRLLLMAEFDKGAKYYVVGFLDPSAEHLVTALPRWSPPPDEPDEEDE